MQLHKLDGISNFCLCLCLNVCVCVCVLNSGLERNVRNMNRELNWAQVNIRGLIFFIVQNMQMALERDDYLSLYKLYEHFAITKLSSK